MNLTGYTIPADTLPSSLTCFDWCRLQVAHAESMTELQGISLVAIACILLLFEKTIQERYPRAGKALQNVPLILLTAFLAIKGFA